MCSYPLQDGCYPSPLTSKVLYSFIGCVELHSLLPPTKPNAWKAWLVGLVTALAFATTLSGTDDHRVVLPEISRLTVEHGWHRLQDLLDEVYLRECFKRSCGLAVSCLLVLSFIKLWLHKLYVPTGMDKSLGPVVLWGATGLGLCITAAGLGIIKSPSIFCRTRNGIAPTHCRIASQNNLYDGQK